MKNRNGFVFVETIVVCAVLAASLVAIYSAFVLVINNQKKRAHYDQAIYNYRSYYAVKSLDNPAACKYVKPTVMESFGIAQMYVVKSNELNNLSVDDEYFKDYIKTIDTSLYTNSCLYIFKYLNKEDNAKNYFSLVYVDLGE